MKTIGILAHSAEGAALCFLTACREGAKVLGPHMHPEIVMSAVPMALSMPGWEAGDHDAVAHWLLKGIRQVADAGAHFFVCPDNTAHLVLERVVDRAPIPGLHIARVVCGQIAARGWKRAGLLGTKWTMTGSVYAQALRAHGIERMVPDQSVQAELNAAIFDELCRGEFRAETTNRFLDAINSLRGRGAECVILGCTEIPLIVNEANSSLPVLDSTRLLASAAVAEAMDPRPLPERGWIEREKRQ